MRIIIKGMVVILFRPLYINFFYSSHNNNLTQSDDDTNGPNLPLGVIVGALSRMDLDPKLGWL